MDETPQLLLQLPTLPDERALGDLLVPHTDKGLAHDDFHWHLRRGLFYMIEQLLALHCAISYVTLYMNTYIRPTSGCRRDSWGSALGFWIWGLRFAVSGLGSVVACWNC